MVTRVGAVAFVLALTLLGSGCSGGATKAESGGSATSAQGATGGSAAEASADSTTTQAQPYVAIAPESGNEKKAAGNVGQALKSLASGQKASNTQSGTNNYVFTNEEGYEPLFVGHAVTLLTGKQDDGTFGYSQVVVLGDKVTSAAQWEYEAGATATNGMLNLQYLKVESPSDPLVFTTTFEPTSAAEKNALARAKEWMATNVADMGFKDAKLTGYVFIYGQPGDRPNAIVWTTPDASGSGSVAVAP